MMCLHSADESVAACNPAPSLSISNKLSSNHFLMCMHTEGNASGVPADKWCALSFSSPRPLMKAILVCFLNRRDI